MSRSVKFIIHRANSRLETSAAKDKIPESSISIKFLGNGEYMLKVIGRDDLRFYGTKEEVEAEKKLIMSGHYRKKSK